MKVEHKIKKINVDPETNKPTLKLTFEFELDSIKDIDKFRLEITNFQNNLSGQKTLKS